MPAVTLPRLALAALIALPMLFNAIALWPEVAVRVPSVNDDAEHAAFVARASDALARGENVIDHWLPEFDLGFPEFFYYQHLPHVAVVALQRLTLGIADTFTVFNLVRWVLLVTFPLTVFWSMRRMGTGDVAAAIGAAASSLISADHLYGFEYDSYTWRGFGLYTQLWAMPLSFIGLACLYRLAERGTGLLLTVAALTVLVLSHLIYAYMLAITAIAVIAFTLRRATVVRRLARLAFAGAAVLAITAYLWVPFIAQTGYLSISPYLQPTKYAGFGAATVLEWFVTGGLFDRDRLPVFTALVFIGAIAAIASRRRLGLLCLTLLVGWLWLYSGRDAIGPLFGLLPLHDGLLFHRFIGGVDIAAILLIGLGGAALWDLLVRGRLAMVGRIPPVRAAVALAGIALLLAPAMAERWTYYAPQTVWMVRTRDAIAADSDLRTILGTLRRLPPGRVYAGLPSGWARSMGFGLNFNSVHLYQLLATEGFETVAPPFGGQSLNADLQFDFNDGRLSQYDLYNARYVVSTPYASLPDFLVPLARTERYVLYEAPTSGYAELVTLSGSESFRTQAALFLRMRAFVNGRGPETRTYTRFDFPAPADAVSLDPVAGCGSGAAVENETVGPGRLTFELACATASPAIVKVTYHPDWVVTIDGTTTPTFMASPSYVGFMLPAGRHAVVVEYRSYPLKAPLLGVGGLTVLGLAGLRRRRLLS